MAQQDLLEPKKSFRRATIQSEVTSELLRLKSIDSLGINNVYLNLASEEKDDFIIQMETFNILVYLSWSMTHKRKNLFHAWGDESARASFAPLAHTRLVLMLAEIIQVNSNFNLFLKSFGRIVPMSIFVWPETYFTSKEKDFLLSKLGEEK